MAGACTSTIALVSYADLGAENGGAQKFVITFADSFHCAYLASVFHSMQTEVDFRHRLLLLKSSESIVYLDSILHPRRESRRRIHDCGLKT